MEFSLIPKVINGGIAGIVGVTCVFPIDLTKTRLQNQQPGPNGQLLYRSLWDCFSKTYRNEGFFGMYRGSGVNLVLITPEKAIKLVGNDFLRHHLKDNRSGKLSLPREIVCGAGAGLFQIIVTTPMELIKIQLQDAGRSARVNVAANGTGAASKLTAMKIISTLLKEKGLTGLYQGCAATMLRDVTFSALYFPYFAHLNAMGKRRENSTEAVFYHTLLSGIIAGGTASLFVNPMDVVKTRLQTIEKGAGEQSYSGIVDCFKKVYKYEGFKAFYKGGLCRILVIAPLFGIAQTVYYIGVGEFLVSTATHSRN
ncbi:mitochondrial glutamate carrier 1-like [Pecten maximus]|uniref:mitochondrial glutamate carrier 1-like n=1 Tax=Pecten maximus TaxID=6579 RepID=UPI00145830A1|nr:mitochondrial glutamate carrier 1-like [Pecten maximus]XP_033739449.1 mitochondrial glutamate carrier 1-like [Pecten maximus]